jgi:hypothetical protein
MNRLTCLATASLISALCLAGCASMGSGAGWETLIDGTNGMENFSDLGGANWRAEGGAIVADRRPGNDSTFLVSKKNYKDFQIHAEFWVSDDANSGIYMRCADTRPMTDRTCYEVNIYDRRPDPSYGTGAITNYSAVSPMPKAGGKWNTFDITVKGTHITVALNGVQTAQADNGKLPSGPIALQYAGGVVKFRKVQIKPL